mmetsp:Transcript_41518/g.118737  ORF Transcript_41518/g.118737 Transcript_41518/m.118737 type:complete len:270 (+) Transcript_41518:479-1288(+)
MSLAYFIDFPTAASAADWVVRCREMPLRFVDPRSGNSCVLRVAGDRSIESRQTMRVMGELWEFVHNELTKNGKCKEGMKLGTTGGKGCRYIVVDGEDVRELFLIKTLPGNQGRTFIVVQNRNELATFDIKEEDATAAIDLALSTVSALTKEDEGVSMLEAFWEFHAQHACDAFVPGSASRISPLIWRLRDGLLYDGLLFAVQDTQRFFGHSGGDHVRQAAMVAVLGVRLRRFGFACFLEALEHDGGVLVLSCVFPSLRFWGLFQPCLHD